MAFTEAERTDIRRFCGYPAYGAGNEGFQGWRFYQVYGLLEYRISHLSGSEEATVRRYLATLTTLEHALNSIGESCYEALTLLITLATRAGSLGIPELTAAAANLDTDQAAVWTHNRTEIQDRTKLFEDWCRRLCGFLGLPAGPALGNGQPVSVV